MSSLTSNVDRCASYQDGTNAKLGGLLRDHPMDKNGTERNMIVRNKIEISLRVVDGTAGILGLHAENSRHTAVHRRRES